MGEEIFFEIIDGSDFIRIQPICYTWPESELDWDKNWIKCTITTKAGQFAGSFEAEFMTIDFEQFRKQLNFTYDNLEGSAVFSGLERQLEIKIKGDGIGHFEADISARDTANYNAAELVFTISFDQTYIKGFVNQLDKIINQFPKIGDLG